MRESSGKRAPFVPFTGMEVAMLERFFLKPQTVDRILGCWLGPRIELYVMALCEQGYSARSIIRRVPILTEFAEFTAARHADSVDRAEMLLDAFVVDWLSARRLDRPADARRCDRNLCVAPSGISSAWSCRSVITTLTRLRGQSRLPDRYRGSSSIFVKSEAFAQALSTTTSITCAGSSVISIRWTAATSARWHCP